MAEPLKYMYNPAFFERLCPVMCTTIPDFDCREFIVRIFNNQWPDLELKQRVRHIATVLHQFMPKDFKTASRILIELSQKLREQIREQSFQCIFLADYIEVYGLDHPKESLDAVEQITQLVSAEFAIRPFIIKHQKVTMKRMLDWSQHKHASVRRLSSEGCRPRLPWAMALPEFKKDPSMILPILENLKNDDSEYVRRSVANNLNDLAKDHPKLVLKIARQWKGDNEQTNWILKHGCRTLLKRGNEHALKLHGFTPGKKCSVKKLKLDKQVKIGSALQFSFQFMNEEKKIQPFRVEYSVDFITATGKTSKKVFQIIEKKFEPNVQVLINRKLAFNDLTTRKHYKGRHALTILVNGTKAASSTFSVI